MMIGLFQSANLQERGADAVYKLDSLKDLPGMLTRARLCSYIPLPDHVKRRAAELNMTWFEGMQLRDLDRLLAAELRKK